MTAPRVVPGWRRGRLLGPLLAGCVLGCSGGTATPPEDGDVPWDGVDAADGVDDPGPRPDAHDVVVHPEDAAVLTDHLELPPLPYTPVCGNGVVDDGEECDDANRLNGDGCDWLCRAGDGDPPPEPDPDVAPYEAEGRPVRVEGPGPCALAFERLPAVWTGTEYAVAAFEQMPDGEIATDIRFRRFDRAGRGLDADWLYRARAYFPGLDLVWTGSGFGLFWSEAEAGIYYMPLSDIGKPTGPAVMVEADPIAMSPAADNLGDGFALVWYTNVYDAEWQTLRMRTVGRNGSTAGPPTLLATEVDPQPDVACVPGGCMASYLYPAIRPDRDRASNQLVYVPADLGTVRPSGELACGDSGAVERIDGQFVAGFTSTSCIGSGCSVCTARFSAAGELGAPPVCNEVSPPDDCRYPSWVRLAAGDRGFVLAWLEHDNRDLRYVRTDSAGVAVQPPDYVIPPPPGAAVRSYGAFNVVWADDAFAVLFVIQHSGPGDPWIPGLYLQRFVAAE